MSFSSKPPAWHYDLEMMWDFKMIASIWFVVNCLDADLLLLFATFLAALHLSKDDYAAYELSSVSFLMLIYH